MSIIEAASRKKRIFDLAVPLENEMPATGAHPQFHMGLVRRHGDKERPGAQGGTSSNELLTTGAHVGTHVDALGHWAVNGKIHGGLDATEATKGGRFRHLGADKIEPMVCRGVLLDMPATLGVKILEPGYGITAEELEKALSGRALDKGDVALIRTGWQQLYEDPLAVIEFVNHATADIAIFLMIGALRQAQKPLAGVRSGNWRGEFTLGHDPNKKVLGIIGMGVIGREVAIRAKAFGMSIIYNNRNRLPFDKELGAKYVTLAELISTSDVISLNLGLTQSNRHMISAPEFSNMKDGVVIVNTARGALIDEEAMLAALKSGKVYSVGLDVYKDEPRISEELIKNPNVFLLPHIGTSTYETQREMEELVLENLRLAVTEGRLITPILEQQQKS